MLTSLISLFVSNIPSALQSRFLYVCEPVKFCVGVVELDPARTHEMTKTVLGFTWVYSQQNWFKTLQK